MVAADNGVRIYRGTADPEPGSATRVRGGHIDSFTSRQCDRTLSPDPCEEAGTWILSPHSDDAALSVGLMIGDGLFPPPVTVITVFSDSGFSTASEFGPVEATTRIRNEEDRLFAALVGVDLRSLGFPDAPLRLNLDNVATVFGDHELPSRLVNQVLDSILAWPGTSRPELVLGPLGVGNHIDHRVTHEVAMAFDRSTVRLYDDQPYSLSTPGSGRRVAHRLGLRCGAVKRSNARTVQNKRRLLNIYSSQPAVRRAADLLDRIEPQAILERLWEW